MRRTKSEKRKAVVACRADKVVNEALVALYKPYEQKRASERIVLTPADLPQTTWLAFHPDNPEVKFKPKGRYAYVTYLQDSEHPEQTKIEAWPISSSSHNDTLHIALSHFTQDLAYAGEVVFSRKSNGKLYSYNNASGTYNPKEENKHQAGFPVKKYLKPSYAF